MMRRINFLALLLFGALWAGTLVVVGALLSTGGVPGWVALGALSFRVGVSFIAAGEFVFLIVVADRLFPNAARSVTGGAEAVLGVALAVSVASVLFTLIGGNGP